MANEGEDSDITVRDTYTRGRHRNSKTRKKHRIAHKIPQPHELKTPNTNSLITCNHPTTTTNVQQRREGGLIHLDRILLRVENRKQRVKGLAQAAHNVGAGDGRVGAQH